MKAKKFSSAVINYFHKLAELTGSGTVKLEAYQVIDDGSVCEPTIVVQGPNGTFRLDEEPKLIAWLENAPEQLCGFIQAIFPRCGPCSFDAITEPKFPATLAGYFISRITRTAHTSDLKIAIRLDKLLASNKPVSRESSTGLNLHEAVARQIPGELGNEIECHHGRFHQTLRA